MSNDAFSGAYYGYRDGIRAGIFIDILKVIFNGPQADHHQNTGGSGP
jgi:hypothetical protein